MNFKRLHPIRMAWVFLWGSGTAQAHSNRDTTEHQTQGAIPLPPRPPVSEYRSFPALEAFVATQTQAQSTMLHLPMPQRVAEFSQDYIQSLYTVPALVAAGRDSARNVFKLLEQTENFIDKLAPGALVELPVGIKKRVGNTMVMIGISRAKYYKDYSELTIFCQMTVPQNPDPKDDKKIFFAEPNQDWIIRDWEKEVSLMEGHTFNLMQMIQKKGYKI